MAKTVTFKTTTGKTWVEFRKPVEDDFTAAPKIFANDIDENAQLSVFDQYGMIFPNADVSGKPVLFLRHANTDKYRFGGFVELNDNPLGTQIGGHFYDMAQKDAPLSTVYQKLSDNPFCYGYGTAAPFSEYRFYPDRSTWKEGDFFDVVATPYQDGVYDHQSFYPDMSQIFHLSVLKGTYEGKPCVGMGGYSRIYFRSTNVHDVGDNLGYINAEGMGQKEDGRFEHFLFNYDLSGKMAAYYWIEGEEPIICDEASMEADWIHLPYVDDGTCVFTNATFRFGRKEFHYEGKWGTKGFTAKPRVERHGQSHILGTWYEGNTPYKHKLYMTISENMGVYDAKLRELGFNVI